MGRTFGQPGGPGGTPGGVSRTFGQTQGQGGAGGGAGSPTRRFGGSGGPTGHQFNGGGAPTRSTSGRTFIYRGHAYARFAGSRYAFPHGYGYQRFVVGRRFPHVFWVQDYYVYDYADYGLGPPPDDYQWMRYGPDMLLVDLDTGEIAQVVYGVFDDGGDAGPPDDAPPDQGGPDQGGPGPDGPPPNGPN